MVDVEVPLATILLGEAEMVDELGAGAIGTDPQIDICGVLVQSKEIT